MIANVARSALPSNPKPAKTNRLAGRRTRTCRIERKGAGHDAGGRSASERRRARKGGRADRNDARIEVSGTSRKYASRGGLKLEGALEDFGIDAGGKICLDIGASTGGFTDCLLQHGARRVYAVDVTPQQMAWRLVQDARVTQIKANARNLLPQQIPEPADLVTTDVSFISVAKVLPAVVAAAGPDAEFLILVKPQFELDRGDVAAAESCARLRCMNARSSGCAQRRKPPVCASRACARAVLPVRRAIRNSSSTRRGILLGVNRRSQCNRRAT